MQDIANKVADSHPDISNVLKSDFYMDDLITGMDDLKKAKEFQTILKDNLSKFGFNLRKCCSNYKKLLENIPTEDIEYERPFFGESIKTLGILWNPSKDNFTINTKEIITKEFVTKRQVASDCGQIFDPLGLVNPVVVKAKLLLQTLWSGKLDWDTKLHENWTDEWNKFRNEIHLLNSLNIPRKIVIDKYKTLELHGFSDGLCSSYIC